MIKTNKLLICCVSVIAAICVSLTGVVGIYPVLAEDTDYGIVESVNCAISKNEDGSLSVVPNGAASMTFETPFAFEKNAAGEYFPGTDKVIPEPMIMFNIQNDGDLEGYMALKWEGHENYGWLMVRDMGSQDGVNTTLRFSYYLGNGEHNTKDYAYVYGRKVFAFVTYCPDVNRWEIAMERVDGLYDVYSNDWHAMGITVSTMVADTAPRRAIIGFEKACDGVDIKRTTIEDIDLNVNPEGISTNGMNDLTNEDGTHILTAQKNSAQAIFNRALIFNENSKELVFEGTEQKVPENALEFSINAKGDLTDWMGIGAVGSTPSNQLFFRDQKTGDDITTQLRVSAYPDGQEYGTFDIDYTYGKKIYVWMRYATDVNRWSFAVEQPDGTYIVYARELHAYTVGAKDYAAPKKLKLTLSVNGDKVTAAALELEQLPGVKPKEVFDVMNSQDNGGDISLWHDGSSVYTFPEYINFTTTSNTFTATSQTVPENVLKLTLQADSIPQNRFLGVRLLAEEDIESAKLVIYSLRFNIVSDNGDGTGKLGISVYHHDNTPNGDYMITDYKFGDPIYIAPLYKTDINRWMVAMPNPSGIAYKTYSLNLWHSDTIGVNSGVAEVPYRMSLIAYNGVKNMTAAIVKSEDVIQNEMPPVPTDTAFVGNGFTEEQDENGYYTLNINTGNYARSTWQTDLTKGLIFRINDFGSTWVSLRLSGEYWKMPEGSLGNSVEDQYTLLLKNADGVIHVSLWDGSSEIIGMTLNGVSATGTHILSVRKVTDDPAGIYYKLTLDGRDIVPLLSIMDASFKKLNNYNSDTRTFDGAFFRFGTWSDTVKISAIRTFGSGEEKEINGWITNTDTSVKENSKENYSLEMVSYSSLKLLKMANLETGITFKIDEIEDLGQFGLAFSMLKTSSSLDIPPALNNEVDVYYNLADNGDGTVTVISSDGDTSTVTMDISASHNYGIVKIIAEDGEEQYTLAIDGKAVFDKGISFERYIQLNNGSLGAFPTLFTKSAIKISGFTGKFTTPTVSNDDDSLWDDEWSDDFEDELWVDDTEDYWDSEWTEDEYTIEEETNSAPTMYKKVLKRVKIERPPIIVEYSLWWLWVIIAVVVVAGATVTFFIIRKKKKTAK